MTTHVHKEGAWRQIRPDGLDAAVGTTPRQIKEAYAHAAGAWRTVHITDATGPGPVTNLQATWVSGGLQATWTKPADADLDIYHVQVFHQGESTVRWEAFPSGATQSLLIPYAPHWVTLYVKVTPYDLLRNVGTSAGTHSMEWTGAARGRVPSPIEFYSDSSGTWRNGAWRTDIWADQYYVYQGSSVTGKSEGAFFYGNKIYDLLRGTTVTAASLQVVRINRTGLGGAVEPEIWQSTVASRADAMSKFGTKVTGPGICRNGDCTPYTSIAFPSSWFAPMVSPSAPNRFRSVVFSSDDTTLRSYIGDVSESYMAMYPGYARPITNNTYVPGRITIAHTG